MISVASRGGYLYLEEEAIRECRARRHRDRRRRSGDVLRRHHRRHTTDRRSNLSDIQRQTIAAALALEESGYRGTTERIGVDDLGRMREASATTKFDDGSSTVGHSVLSNQVHAEGPHAERDTVEDHGPHTM